MALGQTALNAFYQRALTDAAELYSVSGDGKKAAVCEKKANRHRKNCRVRFYNRYLGVYGDGGRRTGVCLSSDHVASGEP